MKLFHFYSDNAIHLGVWLENRTADITATAALVRHAAPSDITELINDGENAIRRVKNLLSGPTVSVSEPIHYAPAILHPGKILCVGLNYSSHTKEIRDQ